jgi:hypothetical protein
MNSNNQALPSGTNGENRRIAEAIAWKEKMDLFNSQPIPAESELTFTEKQRTALAAFLEDQAKLVRNGTGDGKLYFSGIGFTVHSDLPPEPGFLSYNTLQLRNHGGELWFRDANIMGSL